MKASDGVLLVTDPERVTLTVAAWACDVWSVLALDALAIRGHRVGGLELELHEP